jgi:hypothetical protein
MAEPRGRGMGAFFAKAPARSDTANARPTRRPRMRTSITLTQEDADRLELLRLHLRRRLGRGLTFSNVVSLALKCLADLEKPTPSCEEKSNQSCPDRDT